MFNRKILTVISAIALAAVGFAGSPMVNKCNVRFKAVYENGGDLPSHVDFEFKSCPSAACEVYAYNKDGVSVLNKAVPAGETKTFTFKIPAGGNLSVLCDSLTKPEEETCSVTILSITR